MDDTALIQKALEIETEFFDKLNNQKWSHPKEEDGIEYQKLDYGGRSVLTYKAEAIFDESPKNMAHILSAIDYRQKWDDGIERYEFLHKVNDNVGVTYLRVKPRVGGLISTREFLDCRLDKIHKTDDLYWTISASSSITDYPAPDFAGHGAVRGQNDSSGSLVYGIKTKKGRWSKKQCKVVFLYQTNPKGWIPTSAVNQAITGEIGRLIKFIKHELAAGNRAQFGL